MTEDHTLIPQGTIGGRTVGRNTCINVTTLSSTEVSIYLEYISVAPYILEETWTEDHTLIPQGRIG